MTRVLPCTFLALALISSQAISGQISGIICSGSKVLTGATVKISCKQASNSGRTDGNGRFSIFLSVTGSCTLSPPDHNNASAKVFSSKQPTRHDFVLSGSSLRKK